MIENNDTNSEAYIRILEKYNNDPNELNELLLLYMQSVINGPNIETVMFLDEIENMLGIKKHNEILNIIMRI